LRTVKANKVGSVIDMQIAGQWPKVCDREVPIASGLLPSVPSRVSQLAGVSVQGPWIPRQSALCSVSMLQLRRSDYVLQP
jgi:hypothetical protein